MNNTHLCCLPRFGFFARKKMQSSARRLEPHAATECAMSARNNSARTTTQNGSELSMFETRCEIFLPPCLLTSRLPRLFLIMRRHAAEAQIWQRDERADLMR